MQDVPMSGWLPQRWFSSRVRRYAFCIVVTAAFLAIRGALDPVLGQHIPYLAVLPAVVFSVWFCGLGPALLATVLAFMGDQYWFITPTHSLAVVGTEEIAGTVIYFIVSFIIIAFAEINRCTTAKLAVTTEKLRQTGEELRASYTELETPVDHRTRQPPGRKEE